MSNVHHELLGIVGPALEEPIYRGVVLRSLLSGGARQAILLSALCFGLMHHALYQGLSAFWCGLFFGYAALHDGLGMPIGLHIVGNSIAVALPLLRQAGTPGALATSNLARNESTEQSFLACMAR